MLWFDSQELKRYGRQGDRPLQQHLHYASSVAQKIFFPMRSMPHFHFSNDLLFNFSERIHYFGSFFLKSAMVSTTFMFIYTGGHFILPLSTAPAYVLSLSSFTGLFLDRDNDTISLTRRPRSTNSQPAMPYDVGISCSSNSVHTGARMNSVSLKMAVLCTGTIFIPSHKRM